MHFNVPIEVDTVKVVRVHEADERRKKEFLLDFVGRQLREGVEGGAWVVEGPAADSDVDLERRVALLKVREARVEWYILGLGRYDLCPTLRVRNLLVRYVVL
jgi:hypothetical protein